MHRQFFDQEIKQLLLFIRQSGVEEPVSKLSSPSQLNEYSHLSNVCRTLSWSCLKINLLSFAFWETFLWKLLTGLSGFASLLGVFNLVLMIIAAGNLRNCELLKIQKLKKSNRWNDWQLHVLSHQFSISSSSSWSPRRKTILEGGPKTRGTWTSLSSFTVWMLLYFSRLLSVLDLWIRWKLRFKCQVCHWWVPISHSIRCLIARLSQVLTAAEMGGRVWDAVLLDPLSHRISPVWSLCITYLNSNGNLCSGTTRDSFHKPFCWFCQHKEWDYHVTWTETRCIGAPLVTVQLPSSEIDPTNRIFSPNVVL